MKRVFLVILFYILTMIFIGCSQNPHINSQFDIVVVKIEYPTNTTNDSRYAVSVYMLNLGPYIGSCNYLIYLSSDTNVDNNDIQIGGGTFNIEPNGYTNANFEVYIPFYNTNDYYHIIFVAEPFYGEDLKVSDNKIVSSLITNYVPRPEGIAYAPYTNDFDSLLGNEWLLLGGWELYNGYLRTPLLSDGAYSRIKLMVNVTNDSGATLVFYVDLDPNSERDTMSVYLDGRLLKAFYYDDAQFSWYEGYYLNKGIHEIIFSYQSGYPNILSFPSSYDRGYIYYVMITNNL